MSSDNKKNVFFSILYKNSILITSPSIKKKVQIIAFDIDGKTTKQTQQTRAKFGERV